MFGSLFSSYICFWVLFKILADFKVVALFLLSICNPQEFTRAHSKTSTKKEINMSAQVQSEHEVKPTLDKHRGQPSLERAGEDQNKGLSKVQTPVSAACLSASGF